MERAQVYLTAEEHEALAAIAARTKRTRSALIREAVDGFIVRYGASNRLELLRDARGMWRDRDDLPDFGALRREFDERGGLAGDR